jgi:hypothetical protein
MKAQTFIFVHDQRIVLDYLAAGKFNELPDVRYVFLGYRDVDQIAHLVDMGKLIVARWLPDNIEHLPNLVAWTGWYAIAKNNLITGDYVNLFEYDVNVVGKWVQPMQDTNYFPYPSTDETWWNYNGIQEEVERWTEEKRGQYKSYDMPMTSNYTLSDASIRLFINLQFPFAQHPQAGHIMERCCSWFYARCNTNKKALTHLYADSHGTQGGGQDYQEIKSKLL